MRTRIKFCGCTSVSDAQLAVACGVDAVGVIFAPASPRRASWETAREIARAVPAFVSLVAVFVEPSADDVAQTRNAGYVAQFSGNETADQCEAWGTPRYIKVEHVPAGQSASAERSAFAAKAERYRHATWMFDTTIDGKFGGTGRTFDWSSARERAGERAIIISGGLTPENVADCIRAVRPYGVDVRSGIETNGVKDRNKMRAFVRAVRDTDEQA